MRPMGDPRPLGSGKLCGPLACEKSELNYPPVMMWSHTHDQGLTNPLSGCPGQVKIVAGQVKFFLTCPEKCISSIGKSNIF